MNQPQFINRGVILGLVGNQTASGGAKKDRPIHKQVG